MVQSEIARNHAIIFNNNKKPYLKIKNEQFSIVTVFGVILKNLKDMAEKQIGEKISKVIISVPTYADISQRKATIYAGEMAGFEYVNLIDEPIAAALASLSQVPQMEDKHSSLSQRNNKLIFVFDFGGGTLDLAVLKLISQREAKVIDKRGVQIGGDDLLKREMVKRFEKSIQI